MNFLDILLFFSTFLLSIAFVFQNNIKNNIKILDLFGRIGANLFVFYAILKLLIHLNLITIVGV